ncbi:MAG: hypothetical protein WBM96_04435 [Polyangiales bacterium]
MNMTYLLLNPPDPELAKLLRERFPTAFGGRRLVEDSARHADGSDRREPLRDSLMPQAA